MPYRTSTVVCGSAARSLRVQVRGARTSPVTATSPGVGAGLVEDVSAAGDPRPGDRSARNHMVGLVTSVVRDLVMARVEIQCGPHRIVSVMSSEAARELRLEQGSLAVAIIKSTDVLVEMPVVGQTQAVDRRDLSTT
nr:TOBE domain-containing protein [Pseudonocardia sp. Ae717_Ps2]